ncbi:hypothetical protein [Candidatus Planktophila dulcis]|uniref:hypothetical protein n=1 Tax=Candidatus Planktophila dulcis TaxID=1884914 RepID=UPI003CEBE62A
MSTKTTFKRIALVAVAALGLGVLSVAPSSAAVINLTATVADGTATTAASDSTTAASVSIKFTSESSADTVTITSYVSAKPAASGNLTTLVINQLDTATSTQLTEVKTNSVIGGVGFGSALALNTAIKADSTTAVVPVATSAATAAAKFAVYFETYTGLVAGTYTITTVVTPYNGGVKGTATTKDSNIVVSAVAAESKVASPVYSTLSEPTVASKVATVSTTNAAASALTVTLRNASNETAARESITATITGPGTIGDGTVNGKSVVLKYTGALTLNVYADGTAGVSTINVSSTSVTFAAKNVTFFAKAAKTITAAVATPVLGVGANANAVSATAVDANGTAWTGAAYIVASAAADALVGGSATTPVACTYDTTDLVHYCPVTAIAGGTAKFKVIDASTVALATATSNEVTVTVSAAAVASVKLSFDKTSYAPFEKATISVTPLDASGKAVSAQAAAAFLATGGITGTYAFSAGSDTLTATTFATSYLTGAKAYTVYMPAASGDIKITATGGAVLPVAGQVAVSATATIVNSSVDAATDAANEATDAANAATDAALAAADAADAATAAAQDASDAVAALSATVAKLVASLKAQITSLTNLVIKIQKKVKA